MVISIIQQLIFKDSLYLRLTADLVERWRHREEEVSATVKSQQAMYHKL